MSVLSNDGETWLTKLERIGVLAISKPETVFNNIGRIINIDMLRELYEQLDGKKAVGIDGVTKDEYEENLEENLKNLIIRIRRGTYRSKPSRTVEIPKEDGSTRPLAISCIEDKLVQLAVSTILNTIFEPIFLPASYGFRPNRNCHDALRALTAATYRFQDGAIIEIDIRKYFNTIPHEVLLECLRKKISDRRFLQLISVLIKAPIIEENTTKENKLGCPQGSIISPLLGNVYLHYALDTWFEEIKKTHIKGNSEQVRYADDMVFVFEKMAEAERFFKVLPKRLAKFGLTMHLEKSQIIASGNKAARAAENKDARLPTYQFLGFTCYWGLSRNKKFWRLKFTFRADRFRARLKKMKEYLRNNLNAKTDQVIEHVITVVKGWVNYHGISDNRRASAFMHHARRMLFWWINRRGGKRGMNWETFNKLLNRLEFPKSYKTVSMFAGALKQA